MSSKIVDLEEQLGEFQSKIEELEAKLEVAMSRLDLLRDKLLEVPDALGNESLLLSRFDQTDGVRVADELVAPIVFETSKAADAAVGAAREALEISADDWGEP